MERRRRSRRRFWVVTLIVALAGLAAVELPRVLAPPRVVLIGDSLMAQGASAVSSDLGSKGFSAQVPAIPGSGLLDTKVDWAGEARSLVRDVDPDVVVAEFIGDYGLLGERPGVRIRSPQFYAQWAAAAQTMEDILTSRGAQVYWVLGPPVAQAAGETELQELDRIYVNLNAPNTPSGRPLTIDLVGPFSAPGGGYAQDLPGPGGSSVQVRSADGTHFAPAGITRFASTIADAVASGPHR
jgi:hypothetical protein